MIVDQSVGICLLKQIQYHLNFTVISTVIFEIFIPIVNTVWHYFASLEMYFRMWN